MQTVLTYFIILIASFIMQAQNTIEVSMSGFKSNEGKAMVGLFVEEDTFLRNPEITLSSKIINNKSEVIFTDITDGVYAVSVYHDENDNNELDLIMGILPKENNGTSNNPDTVLGPPKWKDSIFEVKGGEVVHFDIIIK
ncbi:MAG: DUF2141 domain-containing protein [Flavobacteriaceae bacterium]|nr:DUF2141 domain-containing protein [Flavobacteriaceae bacterium]